MLEEKGNKGAYLDSSHPGLHTLFAAFAVHDAWATTASEESIDLELTSCFAEVGNLFAGGDVVSSDQGMVERGHYLDLISST